MNAIRIINIQDNYFEKNNRNYLHLNLLIKQLLFMLNYYNRNHNIDNMMFL